MPHGSNKNGSSSAPTSSNAPKTPQSKTPLSEAEFLTKQAADAKAAIGSVVNDLKRDLAQGADPRAWVQVAPWTTLAAAAVGGFVAAAAVVPSKEQQTLRRLRKIEEALQPKRRVEDDVNGDGVRKVEAGHGSFLAALAGQVLRAVQPVLMSALTAGITAKTVDKDQPVGGTDPGNVAYGPNESPASGEAPAI